MIGIFPKLPTRASTPQRAALGPLLDKHPPCNRAAHHAGRFVTTATRCQSNGLLRTAVLDANPPISGFQSPHWSRATKLTAPLPVFHSLHQVLASASSREIRPRVRRCTMPAAFGLAHVVLQLIGKHAFVDWLHWRLMTSTAAVKSDLGCPAGQQRIRNERARWVVPLQAPGWRGCSAADPGQPGLLLVVDSLADRRSRGRYGTGFLHVMTVRASRSCQAHSGGHERMRLLRVVSAAEYAAHSPT